MGVEILGAIQQAPQPSLQSILFLAILTISGAFYRKIDYT
ncbi:hypothetical protein PPIS_a1036 [Pseudoalteromonas piscicida]|uniref:Uncharacterized protein n=1 Tax=Pseudoalteromonas piscicida TaxID=43662 RepID=A0ABM6NBP4_PSEO7|nr:hypothetical protein PPIS_a1036 [Pseudoalteromonas piscicida]MBE0372643.1 hypothetical protein [Pseudoalteromonas flavipulchra NCIMB 2033 = ATCC BAA-314]